MRVAEIKSGTNEDLIMRLCGFSRGTRFTKADEREAEHICKELAERGTVTPEFVERCMKFMRA